MNKSAKIFLAGRSGLVGSAIERKLVSAGYTNIIGLRSSQLDLKNQVEVERYFSLENPEYVIVAAAKVGGIMANIASPADFLYENLMISMNVIHAAYKHRVKKLIFLASSCMYPRLASQPMKEEYILDGKLEPTNEGYALAKISGMRFCEYLNAQYKTNFYTLIPCNIYGEGESFDPNYSHVVAGLINKTHKAKIDNAPTLILWGTGNARRELMHSDDLAEACLHVFENDYDTKTFNVGPGLDYSIAELSKVIQATVGYKGKISFDHVHPDGMPQKLLDSTRLLNTGWRPLIGLEEGTKRLYQWYLSTLK